MDGYEYGNEDGDQVSRDEDENEKGAERDFLWVSVDKETLNRIPRNRLLSEKECRDIGISGGLGPGWEHHLTHPENPNLLFLKKRGAPEPENLYRNDLTYEQYCASGRRVESLISADYAEEDLYIDNDMHGDSVYGVHQYW